MFKGQNVLFDISTFVLEYQDLIYGASYSRRMESSATAAKILKLTDLFFKLFWRGGVGGKIQRLFISFVMCMQETVPTI